MSESELSMLIGELSRFNHGETGSDEDAILDLCDRLEYAEKYGRYPLQQTLRLTKIPTHGKMRFTVRSPIW